MPKAHKVAKTYRHPWRTTNSRWLRRNGLERKGLALVLVRKRDHRQVRDDLLIHRYTLPRPESATNTISEALDNLRSVLITDFNARNLEMRLRRRNGELVGGNTLIRNLKKLPDLPTPDDNEAEENLEHEIDHNKHQATMIAREFDEMMSSPEAAARVALRALCELYGAQTIQEAYGVEIAPRL
jgi:hypothetical protein